MLEGSGLVPDTNGFFTIVLERLGMPATTWRLDFFREWTAFESGRGEWAADFNPLNTTQHMPGDRDLGGDASQNGGNPVREYPDVATGIAATVKTLTNGYYSTILMSLAQEGIASGCTAQLRVWGSTSFATHIDLGWRPITLVPPAVPAMTLEQRIERLEALVAGNGARAKDGTVLVKEAALKDQAARGNSVMLGLSLGQDRDAQLAFIIGNLATGANTDAVIAALQEIINKAKK